MKTIEVKTSELEGRSMSKEVKRFYIMPGSVQVLLSGDPAYTPMANHLTDAHTVPLVLASDYDALLAERDAAQKDAERYRWLREFIDQSPQAIEHLACSDGDLIDDVIDAALQGAQP